MKLFFCMAAILLSSTFVHGEEEGKTKDRVGPGKAVIAANEKEGFKLSEKAQQSLNLSFSKVTSLKVTVPLDALISFQDFLAVYRLRNGWFRLVEVEPHIQGQQATFTSKDLNPGDQMVITNGGLLRVVELDIFGPEADACAD